MLVKLISGTHGGCVFGIGTEGANMFAMQGIVLVIAGSTDIVCDANLFTSLDQDELVVFPICNEGA